MLLLLLHLLGFAGGGLETMVEKLLAAIGLAGQERTRGWHFLAAGNDVDLF